MIFPVGAINPIRISNNDQPASTILNNGPGSLYLYRNSSVRTGVVYDAVIGNGGAFQWGGGELWATSDAYSSVVTMPGAVNVNTGSTGISGTVKTVSAGTASTSRTRGSVSGSVTVNTALSLIIPSSTVAGDLLVCIVGSQNNVGTPSGWSVYSITANLLLFYRTATALDAGSALTLSFSQQAVNATILVIAGVAALTVRGSATIAAVGSLATGVITSGTYVFGGIFGGNTNASNVWAWGNGAQGGPLNPSPWSTIGTDGNAPLTIGVSQANWTPDDSYVAAPKITAGGATVFLATAA